MKYFAFVLLSVSAILFSSCSGDNNPVNSTTGDANQYMPTTTGTTWTYNTPNGLMVETITKDTTIIGNVYRKHDVTFSAIPGRVFFNALRNSGNTCYGIVDDNGVLKEIVNLKDAVVGESWTYSISGVQNGTPYVANYKAKIGARDLTQSVGSSSYSNVIRVDITIDIVSNGVTYANAGTKNIFYAKGVGLIQATETTGTNTIVAQQLISYSIK